MCVTVYVTNQIFPGDTIIFFLLIFSRNMIRVKTLILTIVFSFIMILEFLLFLLLLILLLLLLEMGDDRGQG